MATYLEKLEVELESLMGETGHRTLQACLERVGNTGVEMAFFDKVALVKELSEAFSMIMPENRVALLKLKLVNLKGDGE